MGAMSDHELLERWRGGDRDAGDELVDRHFPAVSRFFRSKVGADEAADLISASFLACVEARDRIGAAGFRAYLFGVARKRLAEHFRGQRETVDLAELSVADLRTSPSGKLARAESGALLRAALESIPVDDQIALELAYWEELSGAEIAAVLDVPPNTARSRLSRARSRLRDALAALATPEEAALAEAALGPKKTERD